MLLAPNGLERCYVRAARRPLGSGRRLRPPRTCTCTCLRLPLHDESTPSVTQTACRPIRHPTDGALLIASIFAAFKRGQLVGLCCLLSEGMLPSSLASTGRVRPTLGWAANLCRRAAPMPTLTTAAEFDGGRKARPCSAFDCTAPSAATSAAICRQQRSGSRQPVSGRGAWAGPGGTGNFLADFGTLLLFYASQLWLPPVLCCWPCSCRGHRSGSRGRR